MKYRLFVFLLAVSILTGCVSQPTGTKPIRVNTSTIIPSQIASVTIASTSLPSPIPTEATVTPILPTLTSIPHLQVCSPLEGITLAELPPIVTNPFEAPHAGQDDGHHGVDFSFYRYGNRIGMTGLQINAVLAGKVVSVVKNRPPYGNMVIIETPLNPDLVQTLQRLKLPEPIPTIQPSRLTCPLDKSNQDLKINQLSLYLLYAHMNQPTALKINDLVNCGQKIGEVGNTGLSSNPHLHLEVRVGPSGARFNSVAHYIGDATQDEMANYCTWRVSGLFQLIDPLHLLVP